MTVGGALGSMRTTKGTVQFSREHPLPPGIVTKIVRARLTEIDARLAESTK